MNLRYKCLGGDLLVLKNLNDCMTISRMGGIVGIESIECMGIDLGDDFEESSNNPFTKEEMDYWLKEYENTEAGKR